MGTELAHAIYVVPTQARAIALHVRAWSLHSQYLHMSVRVL